MYKYIATDGSHFMHVPARDLTDEEYEGLAPDLQALVKAAPFYQHVSATRRPMGPSAAPAEVPKTEAAKK